MRFPLVSVLTLALVAACEPQSSEGENKAPDTASDPDKAEPCVPTDETCNGIDDNCDGTVDEGLTEPWFADVDNDGFGDPTAGVDVCEAPEGFVVNDADCDDTHAAIFPGAPELCNEIDDDCDTLVDEGVGDYWYPDSDLDGFGDPGAGLQACEAPLGYLADATDCDDADTNVNPEALEVCNGIDDDCDAAIDEDDAGDALTWYADVDGDGFGDDTLPTYACAAPTGFVSDATDCDDGDSSVYPGAPELCNGVDDDCDGGVDEDDAADATIWYEDADHDGYGGATTATACDAPAGYVNNSDDCDDSVGETYPGAPEQCNDVDDDCNGSIDDGVSTSTWYADTDGDTYGDAGSTIDDCAVPSGYVGDATDCDDTQVSVNPGAVEACNGIDDDCDGSVDEGAASGSTAWYTDSDGDGYGDASTSTLACDPPAGTVADDTDCDDGDDTVNPGAAETCDGRDEDCDGVADNGVPTSTWYVDADGDGYGDPWLTITDCAAPVGYVATNDDCDDANSGIHPFATELCDSVDQDCDGAIDEGLSTYTWWADADGDGYGDASVSTTSCTAPAGYVRDDDDCEDGDAAINPGATEDCDTLDNDCSGYADDGGLCPCDVEYYGGEPYMYCDTAVVWADARTECLTYGYDLVAINDVAEDAWIFATATSYGFGSNSHFTWIGFNDRTSEGAWAWSNGDAVTYTQWNSGEPNDASGEDCAHIWPSGTWNDIPCTGYPTPFVCEP